MQLALEALESELSPQAASMVSELVASQQGRPPPGRRRAFVPSPTQLKALPLQYGQNTIDFTFAGQRLRAYIHYFNWNSRYGAAALGAHLPARVELGVPEFGQPACVHVMCKQIVHLTLGLQHVSIIKSAIC